jgi:hypothetical protein
MRKLLAALLVLNISVLGYGYATGRLFTGRSSDGAWDFGQTVKRLRFHKEVRYQGLAVLEQGDLAALAPLERSNFWWELNRDGVGNLLSEHPLVKAVAVERCGGLRWGCFIVQVTERQPEFITEFGGKVWLVGADGAFMGRAPRSALADDTEARGRFNPVILSGVDFDKSSPDTLKARLDLIRATIEVVEAGVGRKVRAATLVGAGDVAVRLEDRPYTITFALPDGDTTRLKDEVARYLRLAEELGEKHRLVRSIDLAFERVAVVKFID